MTTRCIDCGDEQRPLTRPASQARAGVVSASVDPRTADGCERGCADSEARLGAALEQALASGLTFGHGRPDAPRCAACDEALDLPMRATLRSVTVEPPVGAPFTLTFALPLVRCGECGTDNVPPGVVDAVRTSARDACGVRAAPGPSGAFRRLRRRVGRGSRGAP